MKHGNHCNGCTASVPHTDLRAYFFPAPLTFCSNFATLARVAKVVAVVAASGSEQTRLLFFRRDGGCGVGVGVRIQLGMTSPSIF